MAAQMFRSVGASSIKFPSFVSGSEQRYPILSEQFVKEVTETPRESWSCIKFVTRYERT